MILKKLLKRTLKIVEIRTHPGFLADARVSPEPTSPRSWGIVLMKRLLQLRGTSLHLLRDKKRTFLTKETMWPLICTLCLCLLGGDVSGTWWLHEPFWHKSALSCQHLGCHSSLSNVYDPSCCGLFKYSGDTSVCVCVCVTPGCTLGRRGFVAAGLWSPQVGSDHEALLSPTSAACWYLTQTHQDESFSHFSLFYC